jgi:hypothetical protein
VSSQVYPPLIKKTFTPSLLEVNTASGVDTPPEKFQPIVDFLPFSFLKYGFS